MEPPEDDCVYREIELSEDKQLRIKEFSLLEDDAGAVVWDAALVAAHYLAHRAQQGRCLVSGRRVLDLGAGTGAVGLAAAALGAAHVALSDLPHLVPYMRENVQLNGLGSTAEAAPLVWGDAASLAAARRSWLMRPPHVVLASDVVYSAEGRQALFATLAAVMVPPPSAAARSKGSSRSGGGGGGGGGSQGAAPLAAGTAVAGGPEAASKEHGPGAYQQERTAQDAAAVGAAGADTTASLPGPDSTQDPQRGIGGGEGAVAGSSGGGAGGAGCEVADGAEGWLCGSGDVVGGSVAVLAFEERPGVEEVPGLCEAHGLSCVEVEPEELHPDWRCPEIHVLLLQKRRQ